MSHRRLELWRAVSIDRVRTTQTYHIAFIVPRSKIPPLGRSENKHPGQHVCQLSTQTHRTHSRAMVSLAFQMLPRHRIAGFEGNMSLLEEVVRPLHRLIGVLRSTTRLDGPRSLGMRVSTRCWISGRSETGSGTQQVAKDETGTSSSERIGREHSAQR